VKILNVQALRAIAAYAVVIHHIIDSFNNYIGSHQISVTVFAAGLDMFFVVSGFVMAESASKGGVTAGMFMRARLARILPIYWLLTMAAAAAIVSGLNLFGRSTVSADDILGSLLLIPMVDGNGAVVPPLLFVGWSLIFEMLFYAILAASLLISRVHCLAITAAAIGVVLVANLMLDDPVLDFLGRPYLLEFAAGIGIRQLTKRMVLTRRAAWIAICAAVVMLVGSECVAVPAIYQAELAGAIYAVPAALLLLGFVSLESRGVVLDCAVLQFQGEASYALYLTHIFVLQFVGKLSIVTGVNQTFAGQIATLGCALLASAVFASLFHWLVERRLNTAAAALLRATKPQMRQDAAAAPVAAAS
jgi:peptidoglycan/LPS O-acetylase OafA/YrhL